jgi:hypothetical protein
VSDKETNINNIGGNNKYNERMIHGVVTSGDRMHACSIRGSTVEIPFPKKGTTLWTQDIYPTIWNILILIWNHISLNHTPSPRVVEWHDYHLLNDTQIIV